jgi:hypothetical protein
MLPFYNLLGASMRQSTLAAIVVLPVEILGSAIIGR